MTYGIELYNEYSESLVDIAAGLTYYKGASGTCVLNSDAGSNVIMPWTEVIESNNGIMPSYISSSWNPLSLVNDNINFASAQWNTIVARTTDTSSTPRNITYYYAEPISTNKDDLVFFEMPSDGLIGIYHIWWPFTGTDTNGDSVDVGLTAFCCPSKDYTGLALGYQVVTTALPSQTSDYGIQVFDADGTTVLFDTSRDVAAFGDHFTLTAAEAEDVIDNNATYTFTLRKNVPNAYIASEGGGAASFKTVYTSSNATMYVLNIKQTANNEITVSREALVGTSLSWSAATYENFEDATFIVTDFS